METRCARITTKPISRRKRGAGTRSAKRTMSKDSHFQTIRQKMATLLNDRDMSARDLSQAIGIREREVYDHLPHVARSASAQKRKLVVLPFCCMSCGYVFEERRRFTRPGRCPRCKKTHVETPIFRLVGV